jgi:hypothetical protein
MSIDAYVKDVKMAHTENASSFFWSRKLCSIAASRLIVLDIWLDSDRLACLLSEGLGSLEDTPNKFGF